MMNKKEWVVPNNPSACQYEPSLQSPHLHKPCEKSSRDLKILPDILHSIHNTPLIRINNITKKDNIRCEVLAKCEFYGAGGSVKDRIGLRMVEDAERAGIIKPGATLIEPTSGNTGIGLALTACVKGYKSVIVIPEKMSKEKIDILKGLGAEIVQTPTSASFASECSNFGVSAKLLTERPNAIVLNQFRNQSNAIAHYDNTAEEILEACEERVDLVVSSVGTGGTLTGIARKVKERVPSCMIIGVDPVGSTMALPASLNNPGSAFFEVEGIGGDFIPTILNRKLVDEWYKVDDREAFHMARRLIREEGILCGGSSGAAMHCALKAIEKLKLGEKNRVVVVFPDSVRNYLTKYLNDDWLRVRGLLHGQTQQEINEITQWRMKRVSELKMRAIKMVSSVRKLSEVLKLFTAKMPLLAVQRASTRSVLGTVSGKVAMKAVMDGKKSVVLAALANRHYKQISSTDTLANLSVLFDYEDHVLVFETQDGHKLLVGVVGRIELATLICRKNL